jgi:hypothetical protein
MSNQDTMTKFFALLEAYENVMLGWTAKEGCIEILPARDALRDFVASLAPATPLIDYKALYETAERLRVENYETIKRMQAERDALPLERKLERPAIVGKTKFGVGVGWSTVVRRAQRECVLQETGMWEEGGQSHAMPKVAAPVQPQYLMVVMRDNGTATPYECLDVADIAVKLAPNLYSKDLDDAAKTDVETQTAILVEEGFLDFEGDPDIVLYRLIAQQGAE